MKLFITGGTGFIGSHFINAAHSAGHELVCIKRQSSTPRINLNKEPTWVYGNLDDEFDSDLFKDVDVFVHLAAHSANAPYDSLEKCLYWNQTASLKLFNIAYNAGIDRFLVAGSCFEYGRSGERYEFIPSDASLEPTMTYPASKASAFCTFYAWSVLNNIRLKYLRIFQVFGNGEAENRFWPSLRKAALNGDDFRMTKGEQIRDFIPVQQVAEQLNSNLDFNYSFTKNPIIKNIGTGIPTSLSDFACYWWKKFNAAGEIIFGALPYRDNEIMRYVPMIND